MKCAHEYDQECVQRQLCMCISSNIVSKISSYQTTNAYWGQKNVLWSHSYWIQMFDLTQCWKGYDPNNNGICTCIHGASNKKQQFLISCYVSDRISMENYGDVRDSLKISIDIYA